MKHADVVKLHELGLISEEQRDRIIAELKLSPNAGANRLLAIFSTLGALLIGAGVILLISANWEDIPRLVKVGGGLALMLGAWYAAWELRERRRSHPQVGEALYLVAALLWLGNIALIGQVYHLSSRPSNAILLWLAGIAGLPWFLYLRSLHIVTLVGAVAWIGTVANERDGWFGGAWQELQVSLYGLCGMALLGFGYCLRGTRWGLFAASTEKTGMLGIAASLALMMVVPMSRVRGEALGDGAWIVLACLGVAGATATWVGVHRRTMPLEPQWRHLWHGSLLALSALMGCWFAGALWPSALGVTLIEVGLLGSWGATGALCLFSLVQMQVGVMLRSAFTINLAIVTFSLAIVRTYVRLFGSMSTTGTMLVVGGACLIAFGVFIERRRRALIARMKGAAP